MMQSNRYDPNYAAPPGALIQEYLDEHRISARELARRCGRSAKLITEIVLGEAVLEPDTALQLERVLELDASIWLQMEAAYRLHLAREEDSQRLAKFEPWVSQFPLDELIERGVLEKTKSAADKVRQFIMFFGVGSVAACQDRFQEMTDVAYRHSPTFMSSKESLLVWLRMGEIDAERIQCKDYDRNSFLDALRKIRTLTNKPLEKLIPEMITLCGHAGVAFVIVRPVGRLALSGISRWISPRKALIQQTMRHLSNDHFWFTFFHEAAHLLLHSRKSVFIDKGKSGNANPSEEQEANDWAANFLIPKQALDDFIEAESFDEHSVREFAREQAIHPGIVVGQLQHRGAIGFNRLNKLRDGYEWTE